MSKTRTVTEYKAWDRRTGEELTGWCDSEKGAYREAGRRMTDPYVEIETREISEDAARPYVGCR